MQASQLCTRARAKKVIAELTVVALVFGCALSHDVYLKNYYITNVTIMVLYIALYVVLPVTVLGKSFVYDGVVIDVLIQCLLTLLVERCVKFTKDLSPEYANATV